MEYIALVLRKARLINMPHFFIPFRRQSLFSSKPGIQGKHTHMDLFINYRCHEIETKSEFQT
jgi:hypothetical protein